MSDTDSFIDEVTEEVRRDALYAQFRRYGWIAVVVVVAIVGGAAYNEWNKAQTASAAQSTGDALLAALESDDAAARAEALAGAELEVADAEIVRQLLIGATQVEAENGAAAAEALNAAATGEDLDAVYRDLAAFKALLASGADTAMPERRTGFEALAQPGRAFSLFAAEQLALLDLEEGNRDGAIARLQAISEDAEATAGLRQRATQLIVALGGEPQSDAAAGQGQ